MNRIIKTAGLVAAGALIVVGLGNTSATAGRLLTGHDIKDGTVRFADLGPGVNKALATKSEAGPAGPKGATGAQGASGLEGAYVSTAVYDNGGNGWATVACNNPTDVAISGSIEAGDAPNNAGPLGSYVIASFAGRMDWDTNSPKAGRTDGWVFGIHADADGNSDNPLIVSAICVPDLELGSTVNHY